MKNSGKLLFFATLLVSYMPFGCQNLPVKEETPKEKPVVESTKKPIIIAVVDTGFDFDSNWSNASALYSKIKKPRVCKMGHKDFTGYGIKDNYGHGTHIAGLIAQYAQDADYCLVIFKFFDTASTSTDNNMENTAAAFQRAIDLKVDIINYSGGGKDKSQLECAILKKALDQGIKVVVAAGNEGQNINKSPYYPAMCDPRLMAVANVQDDGILAESSNYSNDVEVGSRGLYKEHGTRVLSTLPANGIGYMTGTSQATAIKTGKIVRDWKKQ